MATTNLLSATDFNKLCAAVMRAQRKTDKDLQKLAIAAIGYSIVHGDVQPANRLIDAMQGSLRKDAMVAYLERHGNMAYMTGDKKFAHFADAGQVWDDDYAEELADGMMWHEAKKAAEPKSIYDVDAAVEKVLKQIDNAIKGGKDVKNVGLREYLALAVQQYHSDLHTVTEV